MIRLLSLPPVSSIWLDRTWVFVFLLTGLLLGCDKSEDPKLLVFSKTAGFRHESIEAGQEALRNMAQEQGWQVDFTENDSAFYEESLRNYHAVIFLNTTGDVLNPEQENNFQRFIQAGGGFVGIHSATDTEYGWPWYGKLVGAYFTSHPNNPNVREAEFFVTDHDHEACDSLPERFTRRDEFYNFKDISPDIKVLVKIDESTYEGGENNGDHPMSWYQEYDGGRAFYTGMGHTDETFSEPLFLNHLLGGIRYVLGGKKASPLNYSNVRTQRLPEENRFSKVVLDEKLNEPMELAILPDGNVLFIERHGAIKLYDHSLQATRVVDSIAVSTKYRDPEGKVSEAEDGLLGLILDPNFAENNYVYFFYSPAGDEPKNQLARVPFRDGAFQWDAQQVILEVPVQREQCCHTGGSMAWDKDGNLYISTGDNTSPRAIAYAPIDERPTRGPWDAQKSSANTNDLRGKIIRIHPEADGSYTIPEGNLFPEGSSNTRPEIYVMGTRNPYRISLDQKTGYLYWGEVGPDARADSSTLGSRGYDEVNQARRAGNFGWPYFVGNNYSYGIHDFKTGKVSGSFDPAAPINRSPNNTGLRELPPAQPAFIWYPYAESKEFPLLGTGGRNAMAGPVFYSEDFQGATRPFPGYYDGKLIAYDWMRGWIMAVSMDEEGNYQSMERIMPSHKFSNPVDMTFSPEGDLYVLEYGTGWFTQNDDARLVRIEYTAGNRPPQVKLSADKLAGATPLQVQLSAKGSKDPDNDPLSYAWEILSPDGSKLKSLSGEEPAPITFDKAGAYQVSLTVSDGKKGVSKSTVEVLAGNERPVVDIQISTGNSGFFFVGQPFSYEVVVQDREDGSTTDGSIQQEDVAVTIDYLAEGYDKNFIATGHQYADQMTAFSAGRRLVAASDCQSCHAVAKASIGPTYQAIAQKYKGDANAKAYLIGKIKNGGAGVWGEVAMAAHPDLNEKDAASMVDYILSQGEASAGSLPLAGTFQPTIPEGQSNQGVFIIRAAYTDQGANGIPGLRAEQVLVLRSANLSAYEADEIAGVMKFSLPNPPVNLVIAQEDKSYIAFEDVDLTNMTSVALVAQASSQFGMVGGTIELRLDAADGPLIGQSTMIKPTTPAQGGSRPNSQPPVMVTLTPTQGTHKLYFVFRNEQLADGQMLFSMISAMFQAGNAPRM